MIGEQHRQLVAQLLARTREGRLEWRRASGRDEYQAVFPDHTVGIACRIETVQIDEERWEDRPVHSLRIYGSNANLLDEADDVEFGGSDDATVRNLASLYAQAQHKAPGLGAALESILSELNDGELTPAGN